MQKLLPRLLLFISIFSLVSCTITKRKYTGGFYISWNKKAPDAIRPHPTLSFEEREKSRPYSAPSKIAQPPSSNEKNVVGQKIEKAPMQPQVKVFNSPHLEISKSNSPNLTVKSNNSLLNNNVQGQSTTEKPISRKGVALAIIFCVLGILAAFIVIVLIASAPFFTGADLPLAVALEYSIVPLLLLLASVFFSIYATRDGHNMGLAACIILDCIAFLFLLFTALSLK